MNTVKTAEQKHHWLRPVLLGLVVIALVVVGRALDAPARLQQTLEWIQSLGWLGIGVYIALYIVVTVLFVPGSILTLGAGFVYGVVQGSIIASVASTLGATAAFLVGRYVARNWVRRRIQGRPRFIAIDGALEREGWRIVGLVRLSPMLPFNLLNYAFGLTGVSLRDYFFASWIGMIPGTVMYVYFGSLAGSLATMGEDGRGPVEWALFAVGLIATVVATVFLTRAASRALKKKVEE